MPPTLAHALFWACVAACAIGQGALLWSAIRRHEHTRSYEDDRRHTERRHSERWSPDRRSASTTDAPAESRWRELAWSLLPAIALALLLAATWSALP